MSKTKKISQYLYEEANTQHKKPHKLTETEQEQRLSGAANGQLEGNVVAKPAKDRAGEQRQDTDYDLSNPKVAEKKLVVKKNKLPS